MSKTKPPLHGLSLLGVAPAGRPEVCPGGHDARCERPFGVAEPGCSGRGPTHAIFADAVTAIERWLCCHDQRAANWLVCEHRAQVLRTARAWGAPQGMEEDVVQEVFLRVFRSLPRFQTRLPFTHWLAVIARNTCAKQRRHWFHRRRLSACFDGGAQELPIDFQAPCEEPDRKLMAKERLLCLSQALGRLCVRDRLLVEEPPEFCTSAQRVALHRARARLRTHFHQP